MKMIFRMVLTIAIVTAVWVDGASAADSCIYTIADSCGNGAGVVNNYCFETGQTGYEVCVDICDDGNAHFYHDDCAIEEQ